ncbi:PAS domain-containing protein [Cohnella endophytica]|uniref:histidine kinase n=1 Tax=Cohnella endophytica TaxID=2419778 RepID=A0A494XWK8_9BACL|nr:sensor histidine kinase [Cohnella endophytica]RKP54074.1 PAS domain-containing protein [Cohnella endophytica]
MGTIKELCLEHTLLSAQDAETIEALARHLQLIADVSQADVFIDCPLPDKGSALVVAQAQPATAPSLYRTSVIGQHAYARNEPAVMFSLISGEAVVGSRGISQEQIAMQQNVSPIANRQGKIIGALIMEQDISEKVEQERNVERLVETTEQLSETLLAMAMSEGRVQSLMHEGIILFDDKERLTYVNPRARTLLHEMGKPGIAIGDEITRLFFDREQWRNVFEPTGFLCRELQNGKLAFELKAVAIYRAGRKVGGLLLIRDISELKDKEKQLMIKSAVIKEIHHRVKNNLQTVSSLLRLQMRRTKLAEVARVYRDSINRINSIAVIHEMLAYEGLDTIHFNDVVDRISRTILSSSAKPDQTVKVRLTGDELHLRSDVATTLALVLNELIQNCVLHAFGERSQGEIVISIRNTGLVIDVQVTDNGCGIDASAEPEGGGTHLGLKIAETLIEENLDGHISIVSDERGTNVRIAFPVAYYPAEAEDEGG